MKTNKLTITLRPDLDASMLWKWRGIGDTATKLGKTRTQKEQEV